MTETGLNRRSLLAGACVLPSLFAVSARGAPPEGPADKAAGNPAVPTTDPGGLKTQRSVHQYMILPVMVNGAGPFRFVIDSGADHSVISDRLVRQLNLPPARDVMVEGVVRAVRASSVHVATLRFGRYGAEDVDLPVLPDAWLGADGFLGLDLIGRYRVTLDFIRQRFIIEPSVSGWSMLRQSPRQEVISAMGRHGHLRAANCLVDGVRSAMLLDTGAEITVGNSALLAALQDHGLLTGTIGQATIQGVTGGQLTCRTVAFHRMKIQDLLFTGGTIGIADLHIFNVWGLSDRPALLVGMNFLRQFEAVSIDYRRKVFIFTIPA